MSLLGSINPISSGLLQRTDAPPPKIALPPLPQGPGAGATTSASFGQMLEGVVATVDAKQQHAAAVTRQVLLGDTDQMHQSVIAMQEAGVAFSLMVEMRNKLVESYQELMRMQV
jgi:flagellar hook-basal body complex protein FliE